MSAWKIVESDILSRKEVELVWSELCRKALVRPTPSDQGDMLPGDILRTAELRDMRPAAAGCQAGHPRPILDVPAGVAKSLKPRQIPLCVKRPYSSPSATIRIHHDHGAHSSACAALGRQLDRRNARVRFIHACGILGT